MRGTDFTREIENSIDPNQEDVSDVAMMIDLLAQARAAGETPKDGDHFFAAVLLCILLQPFKPPAYQQRTGSMRKAFRNIAGNPSLQEAFQRSLSTALLQSATIEEALAREFDELFLPVFAFARV